MTAILTRIDAALLDHDTSAAQAWVQERIEREVAEYEARGRWGAGISNHVRPMFEILSDDWQDGYDGPSGDEYEYHADTDHDPLTTYAEVDLSGLKPSTRGFLPTSTNWAQMTVTIRASVDHFTEQMRLMWPPIEEAFHRVNLGTWFVVALPGIDPEVARIAFAADLWAADDHGRAFAWPPRPRPDLWRLDLDNADLPVEHPRTGPLRKANA